MRWSGHTVGGSSGWLISVVHVRIVCIAICVVILGTSLFVDDRLHNSNLHPLRTTQTQRAPRAGTQELGYKRWRHKSRWSEEWLCKRKQSQNGCARLGDGNARDSHRQDGRSREGNGVMPDGHGRYCRSRFGSTRLEQPLATGSNRR